MTAQKTSTTQPIVLTNAQIKKCNEIKDSQEGLAQKRAISLLLIHVGNSYAQAAEQSGLSIGQVRYLVTAFKRRGMELFETKKQPSATKSVTKKPATKKLLAAKPAVKKTEPETTIVETEVKSNIEESKKTKKKDKKKLKKVKDKKNKKDKKDKKDKKKGKNKKSK